MKYYIMHCSCPCYCIYSYKRRRVYLFSKREPNESTEPRDVVNEILTEEEKLGYDSTKKANDNSATEAIIRTSQGILLVLVCVIQ